MNQTLEGHSGAVICLAWNPHYRKLTSSDENGMIIVWMLHKGMWYEEMINNRNKSVVKDMKWTSDGKKICIIYEDGAVIVGSVDGNRIWGKELSLTLRLVEWSPDSRSIMFASGDLDLILYDSDGSKIKNMALSVSEADARSELVVAAVHWYNGIGNRSASLIPSLCIAFSNGTVQLSRGEWDPKSIIFDAEMEIRSCKWSPGGTVLALMGTTTTTRGDATRTINVLKFYDPMGVFMRYIRIPGESVASFAWEGDGLRIALAVDAFVFFSNIRPVYKWAYLENTVVYSFYKPERRETALVFWDLHGSDFHIKYIPNLKILLAAGGICAVVLVDRGGEEETSVHSIQLRNSVGAVVDSRTLPIGFNPICANICATHVVLASTRTVYVWQFSSSSSGGVDMPVTSLPGRAHQSRERMFDVETASMSIAQSPELFKMNREEIDDAISCVAISEKYLVVARQGGYIQRYTQPHLSTENVYIMRSEPYRIELSCSSSRLGCIDSVGIFTVIDLEARVTGEEEKEDAKFVAGEQFGRRLTIEKRDVWDMRWSSDNEESIAVMEKDKLVIYCGEEAEEPIVSYGYLARFENLQVRSVFLDDIYSSIEQMPPQRERVIDFETRGIREVRDVIASEGLEGAYRFAASRPHPKLWKLLAETALSEGDLNVAEKSFVKAEDYFGVQFVKQLRSMPDKMKMRAEIAVYLNRFDEAESIYIEIDRRDLAVELRSRLGDFSRVVPLLHNLGGSDKQLGDTYDQVGEYFADRFKWRNAAHYFGLAHNNSRLADSLYRSENFDGLRQLSIELTEGSPLLAGIAAKFESIGMATEAVECYLKGIVHNICLFRHLLY